GTSGLGTVFELAAGSGAITTLANFNGANGANPDSGVVMDAGGDLFGTTLYLGNTGVGAGTVFEVAAGSSPLTTLASFNFANGAPPAGALVMDGSGNLFGTTVYGGTSNQGTVFKFTPDLLPTVTTVTDAGGTYDGVTQFAATVTVTGA